jgi:hypothetical protein
VLTCEQPNVAIRLQLLDAEGNGVCEKIVSPGSSLRERKNKTSLPGAKSSEPTSLLTSWRRGATVSVAGARHVEVLGILNVVDSAAGLPERTKYLA